MAADLNGMDLDWRQCVARLGKQALQFKCRERCHDDPHDEKGRRWVEGSRVRIEEDMVRLIVILLQLTTREHQI